MPGRRAPRLGARDETAAVDALAGRPARGALPQAMRLPTGELRMVGARHDRRVGMVIPSALDAAWAAEARLEGMGKTDLFQAVMLERLLERGWEMPAVTGRREPGAPGAPERYHN